MDAVTAFDAAARIARTALDPRAAVSELADCLESGTRPGACVAMRRVDVASDIASVRAQLEALLRGEPPPPEISVHYFGLFDSMKGTSSSSTMGFEVGRRRRQLGRAGRAD
jgi:hypothetical protein